MNIDDTTLWLIIISVTLFLVVLYCAHYILKLQHQIDLLQLRPKNTENKQMQLIAYERLALFTERNKIENLVTKLNNSNYTAKDMQYVLINNIKEEYEYNISQQLYVKPEIWDAVTKMKQQNIYIINQVANTLPQNSNAMDLNRQLLELINTTENVTMNNVVLDALQYETKQLL